MIRILGMAALVSLMATTGIVSTASADSFGWGIYIDGPRDGRGGWDRPRHDDRHRPGWGRPNRRGECHPNQAVEKARWNGLRRAFVADVSPRRVVVAGFRHGGRDRIVFANVRGCPVIGR
ncbi:MAG: hypothetical protein QE284_11385 [Rhizobium sp.]|nr:hypothetical protein [Rhizobium sp.]